MVFQVVAFSCVVPPHSGEPERIKSIFENLFLTLNVIPLTLGSLMAIIGAVVAVMSLMMFRRAIGPKEPSVFIIAMPLLFCVAFLVALIAVFL